MYKYLIVAYFYWGHIYTWWIIWLFLYCSKEYQKEPQSHVTLTLEERQGMEKHQWRGIY